MKRRTFTVLFTDEYDVGNGVTMTDDQAVEELKENLQAAYDGEALVALGSNFLIIGVEDGDARFWEEWALRTTVSQPKLRIASDGVFTHEREYDPVEEAIDAVGHALALKSENPDATITLVVV